MVRGREPDIGDAGSPLKRSSSSLPKIKGRREKLSNTILSILIILSLTDDFFVPILAYHGRMRTKIHVQRRHLEVLTESGFFMHRFM